MAAIRPVEDSVPCSLKMSRRRPVAALEEKRRIRVNGRISPGKPRWLVAFPRRSLRKVRKPEARRTPTAVIRPIRVGQIEATVFRPSRAPSKKILVNVSLSEKARSNYVKQKDWDYEV